jgi:hypothetical protein
MYSPAHGSGLRGGDVIEAVCSGVWGIDQGSFHLTDDEDWCYGDEDPWTERKSTRDEMVPENRHGTL